MTKHGIQPPRFVIRLENRKTWVLIGSVNGADVGGVNYRHNSHGDHYQPWHLTNGERFEFGVLRALLGQVAEVIKVVIVKR